MLDFNDAEPSRPNEAIPDGTFAKVIMAIRPGGLHGESPADRGLLTPSRTEGSDVVQLDCEFTILEGPFARRKFWRRFVVSGGKVDEHGVSIGWKITKSALRSIIDSAHGLDPNDESPAAAAKRRIGGFNDLNNVVFVAKIATDEEGRSELDAAITKDRHEWGKVMAGESVPARPGAKRRKAASATPAQAPAWQQGPAAPAPASSPGWGASGRGAPPPATGANTPASAPVPARNPPSPHAPATGRTWGASVPAQTGAPKAGPAWLNE